jgi:ribosomal protein S18 acetylase RimI-like enzyme
MTATRPGMDAGVDVRKASIPHTSALAAVLGRAFFDEPLTRWAMPDDDRRRQVMPEFFKLFVRTVQRYNTTYMAGDAVGAALWVPPGYAVVSEEEADAFNHQLDQILGVDAPRFAEIFTLFDEHHPHGSFFYLPFLGVEPEYQNYGIGSALLRRVLDQCDREGVSAYLEATNTGSRRLYERHGFEAIRELSPSNGPPLWPMWRRPTHRNR